MPFQEVATFIPSIYASKPHESFRMAGGKGRLIEIETLLGPFFTPGYDNNVALRASHFREL